MQLKCYHMSSSGQYNGDQPVRGVAIWLSFKTKFFFDNQTLLIPELDIIIESHLRHKLSSSMKLFNVIHKCSRTSNLLQKCNTRHSNDKVTNYLVFLIVNNVYI